MHTLLRLRSVDIFPNSIPDGSHRFISPAMERQMWKVDPDRDGVRDVHFRIKVWGPSVEIKASSVHEIRAISENEVAIFHGFEKEGEEPPSTKPNCNLALDHCVPVSFNPALDRAGGRPQACELAHQAAFSKGHSSSPWKGRRQRDFRDFIQLFDELGG